ncbi:MAG TPA: hypothetical protein VF663_10140 [Telluria sp.]
MRLPITLFVTLLLLLLLMQHAALTHAVKHWAPAVLAVAQGGEHVTSAPALTAHVCDLCVAASQFAAALPAHAFALQLPDPGSVRAQPASLRAFLATLRLGFHSRAPPAL